jgi:outer membrane receptor protein involved in Fe transport
MLFVLALAAFITAPALAEDPTAAPMPAEEAVADDATASEEDESEGPVDTFYGVTSVTVTGSEIDTFDVAPPVIVIDEMEIEERQPNNAADLLRLEPGVDVNGVGPNQARPVIRGLRGLRVLFLENGLRMNNARRQTDFGEITGLVDINGVQTMEVVRGPASVLYGSDAIGGVLNLITKSPAIGTGSDFSVDFGGRYSTAGDQGLGHAGISGYSGKLSYRLYGSYRDSDDYDAPSGSFGGITLDDSTPVVDTGVQDDTINAYLGWNFHDKHSIYGRLNRYRADETGFGFVEPDAYGESTDFRIRILYPYQDFDRYTAGYEAADLDTAIANTADFKVYFQSNERELANDIFIDIGPAFGPGPSSDVTSDTLNFTDVDTWGGRGELTKTLGESNLLTYGIEYYQDDSFNTDSSVTTTTLRANFPLTFICGPPGAVPPPPFECRLTQTDDVANAPNAENTAFGLFVQDEWYLTDRFTATLGLRYSEVETKAKPTPGWDITGLDFSDDAVVGALNLTYLLTDNLRLVGSYGTAFRAPNIVERLFNGLTPEGAGYQVLNPNLISEESENIDVGIKYRRNNAWFEAMYFDTEIDDAIVQYTLTDEDIAQLPQDVQDEIEQSGVQFVVQQRNAEVYKIDGFELVAGYRFNSGISLSANYTSLDGESVFGGPATNPTGDTYSDKLAGYVRYDQRRGRYWIEYRVRHNGEQDLLADPGAIVGPLGEVIPSFTVHDLAAGVRLFETARQQHSLNLFVNNLTDELYAEFSNATFFRPEPERTFMAAYRVRLK